MPWLKLLLVVDLATKVVKSILGAIRPKGMIKPKNAASKKTRKVASAK
jgi:hypothetical protein